MKKIVIFLFIFISLSFCFAKTYSYSDITYSYAVFKEKGELSPYNSGYNTNCINIGAQAYFGNKPLGLYMNCGFYVPNQKSVSTLDEPEERKLEFNWSYILGTCLKLQFSKQFQAFAGLGVHGYYGRIDAQRYNSNTTKYGFAGDVGLKFIPKDHFGFVLGTLFSYDISYQSSVIIYSSNNSGVIHNDGNCKTVCFRPYIGITIHQF